ncbi:YjiH family protein [Arhodomonas sp. AD133]|uniref:YjiH family protein n=1 Tax=Arhodomonas sp. AD133 TaxID=3415009 RepID=UPI003EB99721
MSDYYERAQSENVVLDDTSAADTPGFGAAGLLKFLVPSLIGALMFLTPIVVDGQVTIGMGVLSDWLKATFSDSLPAVAATVLTISAVASAVVAVLPAGRLPDNRLMNLLRVGPGYLALRVTGAVFAVMTLFEIGPEWVWGAATGSVVLNDLAPVLITFFFAASILLPFLVDFGLMEFIGTLVRNVFRRVFNLPGRSAIDATASWLGSGTVGVLITTQQYERGFYSKRESSVIATNFSIVSIAFAVLVTSFVDLNHLFVPFYATVVVAGLIAALVVPRLPPLSRKPDEYNEATGRRIREEVPEGTSLFAWGVRQAVARAERAPAAPVLARDAAVNYLDILFGLLPLVMAIGTLSLVVAEHTPLFQYLSYPFVPVLEWMAIPEAEKAAPAMLVGFADMFLPAVLAQGIESELTRFVIACVSLTQLIYMSEIGVLLMKSKIPLGLWELAAIFLLRTVITLPIIVAIAHWVVF